MLAYVPPGYQFVSPWRRKTRESYLPSIDTIPKQFHTPGIRGERRHVDGITGGPAPG